MLRVLTWNLFHGRASPPDPRLRSWRSRLLRASERDATHLHVNRDLLDEFCSLLAASRFDVALLQEAPPRWATALAATLGAERHLVLTSRNSIAPLRRMAARANPDLVASNEGGSNLTLVRGATAGIVARRELVLRRGPRPERRVLAFTRIRTRERGIEVCVGNLHASAGEALRRHAEGEAMLAARRAVEWARGAPLVLGGDFNLRPRESAVFERLEAEHGLAAPTAPRSLDHLLARGLDLIAPARAWRESEREIRSGGLAIRLSDHAPVEAAFELPEDAQRERR